MIALLGAWLLGGTFMGFTVFLIMRRVLTKRIFWCVYLSTLLEERYGAVAYYYPKCGCIEVDLSEAIPGLEEAECS